MTDTSVPADDHETFHGDDWKSPPPIPVFSGQQLPAVYRTHLVLTGAPMWTFVFQGNRIIEFMWNYQTQKWEGEAFRFPHVAKRPHAVSNHQTFNELRGIEVLDTVPLKQMSVTPADPNYTWTNLGKLKHNRSDTITASRFGTRTAPLWEYGKEPTFGLMVFHTTW